MKFKKVPFYSIVNSKLTNKGRGEKINWEIEVFYYHNRNPSLVLVVPEENGKLLSQNNKETPITKFRSGHPCCRC